MMSDHRKRLENAAELSERRDDKRNNRAGAELPETVKNDGHVDDSNLQLNLSADCKLWHPSSANFPHYNTVQRKK